MGDFFQNGVITTLHDLGGRTLEQLENELRRFSEKRSLTLVIPSLFSELEAPALSRIVDELEGADYLDQIVIGLDRADRDQYRHAKDFFSRLPQRHRVMWHDGPRLRGLADELQEIGLGPRQPGKGRNVWYCFGFVLATGSNGAVALHDADIVTYERRMLARLLYPIANPAFTYQFAKGYFARVAHGKMHGRVARLFVTPLVRSLRRVFGPEHYLDYLDSFRYPLAGEFAVRTDVLRDLRIPGDWGLEVGVLSELYRNYSTYRICQVDIADVYEHKHQPLSPEDKSTGLARMAREIAGSIFGKMSAMGYTFTTDRIRSIQATYHRMALDMLQSFYDDAMINGLQLDRHHEEEAIELFSTCLVDAGEDLVEQPTAVPFITSWDRIASAIPDFPARLHEAVELDTQEG